MTTRDRVAWLLEASGLSSAEFGRRCCLSKATIASITRGDRRPTTETLVAVAVACDVPSQWITFGIGRTPSKRRIRARFAAAAA